MGGAATLGFGAAGAQKVATRIRRKSKELEENLEDMVLTLNASNATRSFQAVIGARAKRKSADYTMEELQAAFDSVDKDKSGSIDKSELKKVSRPQGVDGVASVW